MRVTKTLAWLLSLVFVGLASAQDKPTKPTFGELPPVIPPKVDTPPVPGVDDPRDLSDLKFRLIWVSDYSGTIPVRWSQVSIDGGRVLLLDAPKSFPGVIEGESEARTHDLPAGAQFVKAVWCQRPGKVVIVADGVVDGAIVNLFKITVNVKGGTGAQPPPGVGNPPGGWTPVTPAKYTFLIVRPNGAASPDYLKAFSNPAWNELVAAGHVVKEMTLTESQAIYNPPAGTTNPIPFTVTLASADGKSKVVAGPVAMPTDTASIRKLLEGIPK